SPPAAPSATCSSLPPAAVTPPRSVRIVLRAGATTGNVCALDTTVSSSPPGTARLPRAPVPPPAVKPASPAPAGPGGGRRRPMGIFDTTAPVGPRDRTPAPAPGAESTFAKARGLMSAHRSLLAAALAAALLAPLARADLPLPSLGNDPPPKPEAPKVEAPKAEAPKPEARSWNVRQSPVADVVKRVREAVVNIHSERTARAGGVSVEELFALAPSQNRVNGMGTGIVIDPRGYIVTNQHVVEDVSSLRCRLADGTVLSAKVL